MRTWIGCLLLIFLGVSTLTGCGGGGDDNGDGEGNTIEVKAEDYKFDPAEIRITAGETVTIKLKNVTKQAHDLEVQRLQVEMVGGHESAGEHTGAMPGTLALHSEKGKTVSATFVADGPGTYEFFCTIPGHAQLGMTGKLIVESSSNPTSGQSISPNPTITLGGGHDSH